MTRFLPLAVLAFVPSLFAQPPADGPSFGPAPPASGPADVLAAPADVPGWRMLQEAQIIAQVGDEHILAGDLLGQVNEVLAPYVDQMPPDVLEQQRQKLLQRLLQGAIEAKLLYNDFVREIPPDKMPELEKQVYAEFDRTRLVPLMERHQAGTPAELDQKLRALGSSLEKSKRNFLEMVIASQNLRRKVKPDAEVSYEQMLDYYQAHAADYATPARVRYEQLSVWFERFPNKPEAYRALAEMGNDVLRGAPWAEVARARSQDFHAEQGGYHDWTSQGALASKPLDAALFSLPVGRPSEIIEDDKGFHIVRVLEREPAGRVPFTDAQVEIRDKLKQERLEREQQQFIRELREKTPIWTAFEGEAQSGER